MLPDIEVVASAVHDAWMRGKTAKGFTSALSQQTGEEQMRPYAELSEEVKEYDRATVRTVYDAIESAKGDRPTIICLCGSTRFIETFAIQIWELERQGFIVLGCTLLPTWYCKVADHFGEATGTKEQCDEHHLRKIDLADEVLVLNVGGYIGESTRNEIAYAAANRKPVRYLEPIS